MIAAWLSFAMVLAGFGLISLAMRRHAGVWTRDTATIWVGAGGKAILRLAGAASLIGSGTMALHDNLQLGAIYWSAYAMAAVLLITGLQTYAERWAVRVMLLVVVGLSLSTLAYRLLVKTV